MFNMSKARNKKLSVHDVVTIVVEDSDNEEEHTDDDDVILKEMDEQKENLSTEEEFVESYEEMVKRRIAENKAILAAAGIPDAIKSLSGSIKKPPNSRPIIKKIRNTVEGEEESPRTRRKSARLSGLSAPVVPPRKSARLMGKSLVRYDESDSDNKNRIIEEKKESRAPPDPFNMEDVIINSSDNIDLIKSQLALFNSDPDNSAKESQSFKVFLSSLSKFTMDENCVAKLTTKRIYSMSLHPDKERLLVACGDTFGNLGLWSATGDAKPIMLQPYKTVLSYLMFNPWTVSNLITCSFDGIMRYLDLNSFQFNELMRTPDEKYGQPAQLLEFDLHDRATIYASSYDGSLYVTDQRSKSQFQYLREMDRLRTVTFNPVDRNYLAVGGVSGNIKIFDVRQLTSNSVQPVCTMTHNRGISSCRFSPDGTQLLVTPYENIIKLYNSEQLIKHAADPVKLSRIHVIPHNNHTGLWLSKFKAEWVPDRNDCFLIGSLQRPRVMELYSSETGGLRYNFQNDFLTSVCSSVSMHSSQAAVVGGNSSGRVFIMKQPGYFCN